MITPHMITAATWAVPIVGTVVGVALIAIFRPWQLIPWRRIAAGIRLARAARRCSPHGHPKGRHRLDGEKTAGWFRSLAAETPAPDSRGAAQARRPGDPLAANRAVRGAATTSHLWPGGPVTAPAGSRRRDGQQSARATMTPAPRGAVRAGQATSAATDRPPVGAARLPQPEPVTPVAAADSPGLGQHAFDGHREPWYVTIGERTPPGRLLAVGYDPFSTGPRAVIPDPRVSLRVTGAHAVIPAGAPLVSRRYAAYDAWRDEAVNT